MTGFCVMCLSAVLAELCFIFFLFLILYINRMNALYCLSCLLDNKVPDFFFQMKKGKVMRLQKKGPVLFEQLFKENRN